MALDFPNAPTLNQTFTAPNGTIWLWDGVKWTAITSTSPYTGQGNVGRNLLHNPLFQVAQRGVGPFTASGSYLADRWQLWMGTDTASISIVLATDASRAQVGDEAQVLFLNNAFAGAAGAGNTVLVQQAIEGVRRLAGKTVTLSFFAYGSLTQKFGMSLDQNFGTGGSPSATVTGTGQAVTLSSTWARYSMTFAVPSASGKTLGTNGNDRTILNLWFSAGSNFAAASGSVGTQSGTIALWGVQLEIGSVATPLEKPDPRYDLANCQRFFCGDTAYFIGYGPTGTNIGTNMALPNQMRAVPTAAFAVISNTNVGTVTLSAQSPHSVIYFALVTATGQAQIQISITASADL